MSKAKTLMDLLSEGKQAEPEHKGDLKKAVGWKKPQIREEGGPILHLANKVQKALWEHELKGQISDGYWENASPRDHYKAVNRMEVVADGKLGVSGNANVLKKRNYDFAAKALLDVVGQRMVCVANLASHDVEPKLIDAFDSLAVKGGVVGNDMGSLEDINAELARWEKGDSAYYRSKAELFKQSFESPEKFHELVKGPYDLKKVKAELVKIKEALKTDLS